ncbi:MAG: T9SS type A sorting domain-containing protein [Ignavibacteria bacterium]|nr:T9SS type A sorting domain-containing protein [Ignavibacteria bacterium]
MRHAASLIIFLVILGEHPFAQTNSYGSMLWVGVQDDASPRDTLTLFFGNHPDATFGADTICFLTFGGDYWYCSTITESWWYLPPPAFEFAAYWVSLRVHNPYDGPDALIPYDIHPLPTDGALTDTFTVRFQNFDSVSANFTFTWPDSMYLQSRCDSMFLEDPTHCALPTRINMFRQRSVTLVAPQLCDPTAVIKLQIHKYGVRLIDFSMIDVVEEQHRELPIRFTLEQNYPNPFNASTLIRFTLPMRSKVQLTVFDILGRRIENLVDEVLDPNAYAVHFEGSYHCSGVYYYELKTDRLHTIKSMLIMK